MKVFCCSAFTVLFVFCFGFAVFGQEDLSRPDGLPSRIGGPSCTNSNGRPVGTVTGFLHVNGVSNTGTTPTYSVALYAEGTFFARRRLKNGGSFAFYCVPRSNVSIIGEVDSTEVINLPIGTLSASTTQQDVNINLSDLSGAKQRTGVVSAQIAYNRSKENEARFDKALDQIHDKNNDKAEAALKQIVEDDPKDWPAWIVLGNLNFNASRFPEAAEAYSTAIALKGDQLSPQIGLARAYIGTKQFDKAEEVLLKAQTLQPTSADVYHYLGETYLQSRKGTLAIEHFRKAIELSPAEKADLHLRIGGLYRAAGAKDLAAKEFKDFLQKRPDYPQRKEMEKYISENLQQ